MQNGATLEERVQSQRKKFDQLVDLIRDIWQEEVQAGCLGNNNNNNGAGAGPLSAAGMTASMSNI